MHRMNPECLDPDPPGLSIPLAILLREEPDEEDEDEDEEEQDGGEEGDDEGYSE